MTEPEHPVYQKFAEIIRLEHPVIWEWLQGFQVIEVKEDNTHLCQSSFIWFSAPSKITTPNPAHCSVLIQAISRVARKWSIGIDYGVRATETLEQAEAVAGILPLAPSPELSEEPNKLRY